MKKILLSLLIIGALSMTLLTDAKAKEKNVTVLLGDSNTAGSVWIDNQYDPAKKWSSKLEKTRPILNSGVGGNTTGMAKGRVKSLLSKNAKTVTIMFGTNDAVLNEKFIPKTSLRQFEKDLNYFVDTFKASGTNVILMTAVPVIEEGEGNFYSRHDKKLYIKYGGARKFQDKYNDVTRKVAKQKGVPLVDTYKIFLRYSGNTNTDETIIKSGLMDHSGTHMSMYGAEILYRSLNSTLNKNKY
jgi:lysophospholipase L1-like esterase